MEKLLLCRAGMVQSRSVTDSARIRKITKRLQQAPEKNTNTCHCFDLIFFNASTSRTLRNDDLGRRVTL